MLKTVAGKYFQIPLKEEWVMLTSLDQWQAIKAASFQQLQLVYKHSTRCSTSSSILVDVDKELGLLLPICTCNYLDLLAHRDISNTIAEDLAVVHQSPQVIIIKDGKAILVQNHIRIEPEEIIDSLADLGVQ